MADLADADYVVVGGGITGCVIASRLSQSGDSDQKKPQVVLLEAGPDPAGNPAAAGFLSGLSLLGSEYDYSFRTEPVSGTADRVHTLNVGKVLGGGSILNLGGWLRADAADYDDWGHAVGDERWSYAGLKPWFCKTERFFSGDDVDTDTEHYGRDGPMHVAPVSVGESGIRKYPLREPVREAWAELGVPANLRRKHGHNGGLVEFSENAREGMRQPAQSVYPLDDSENPVRVYTNTLVRRVIFSEKKDKNGVTTAIGVELADGRTITARKEVILCAGAFRTPQVLMLSGIGPSAVLEAQEIPLVHDAPDVGQNLHDHFALYLAYRLRDPSLGQALGSAAFQAKMDPKFSNSPLPWDWVVSQPLPAEVIEKHASEAGKTTTEKQYLQRNLFEVITIYVPPIPGIPIGGSHIATSTMLLRPTSRGAVTLRSRDPNDAPRIQPNHLATTLDRDTLVHAARTTLKAMLETTSMKAIVAGESPPSVIGLGSEGEGLESPLVPLTADDSEEVLEDRIRRTGMAHAHPGGTAAMGKVVDTEGKVLGVKGLRVADASIVPIPLGGHPQATLYAMAEQLASFILRDD
ncbi:choline dehydrogenase [Apiospora arundinis]|uniref:Choline dehydrogenase n=1 Tax=Apiospora arundinis TaxID=335852 RepID=A0ABR2HSX3_9PEZI